MPDLVPIRRALISVSDKTGLEHFARALADRGIEIISTGGTARALTDAGLPVTPVEQITDQPEIMEGRVKTLHPRVHAAILADRDKPEHLAQLEQTGAAPIDLLCVNLYPFESVAARPGVAMPEAVENIDVGGPSMLRGAAKNHAHVTVLADPDQYQDTLDQLERHDGATSAHFRLRCAVRAFGRLSAYDAAIAGALGALGDAHEATDSDTPEQLTVRLARAATLRYGENPHQHAAAYRVEPPLERGGPDLLGAEQLHGKQLGYNNLLDASAALRLVSDLDRLDPDRPAACVIKHANPCGAATARTPADALRGALAGDPVAAFGGIVALSAPLDEDAAALLVTNDIFLEVVAAPGFEPDALERLRTRWKNLRVLRVAGIGADAPGMEIRSVAGGALLQQRDTQPPEPERWRQAAGEPLDPAARTTAAAAWVIAKHLASNAIALLRDDGATSSVRLVGFGAGQVDRVTACRHAAQKAGALARGGVAASDAFFPFADGPEVLCDAGVAAIVHPGGSRRDQDTTDLCAQRGVALLTTGVRHFRH